MSKQSTISRFFKPIKKDDVDRVTVSHQEDNHQSGNSKDTSICLDDSSDDDMIIENHAVSVNEHHDQPVIQQPKTEEQTQGPTKADVHDDEQGIKHFAFKKHSESESDSNMTAMHERQAESSFDQKLGKIMKKRKVDFKVSSMFHDELNNENNSDENESTSKSTKKGSGKLTPLDQQVQKLKLENMDKVLVVRVGYKYKCFAQDAVIVSKILQIKLIPGKLTIDGSNDSDANYKQFAYCSFPDVRLDVHLQRLVYHNLKVAVVEQSETTAIKKNSSNKSNVFQREISNTFSKATYGVNHSFDRKSNTNPILGNTKSIWALEIVNGCTNNLEYRLVSVNLNSGEIITDIFSDNYRSTDKISTRIKYLEPSECVVISSDGIPKSLQKVFTAQECILTVNQELPHSGEHFTEDEEKKLAILFDKLAPQYGGNQRFMTTIKALVTYLKQYNLQQSVFFSSNYKSFASTLYMTMDHSTIECLDISSNSGGKGSLFWILDHTRTSFGSRKLRQWILHPLVNHDDLEKRYDAIDCIRETVDDIFFDSLNNILSKAPDLLNTLNRMTYGRTSRKEVYFFLKQLIVVRDHFKLHDAYIKNEILNETGKIHKGSVYLVEIFRRLVNYFASLQLPNLFSMINISAVLDKDTTIQITEFFNLNNYDNSAEILDIQRQIEGIKSELDENLKSIRKILKRPYLEYKNNIEYLIEIRNTQVKGVPPDWVKVNSTKVVSRFWTPSTAKLVDRLNYLKEVLIRECNSEYVRFLGKISEEYSGLKSVIESLAEYDCILSLAATSCNTNYCRPQFHKECDKSQYIHISQGRNPIIESLDVQYVPNDVNMAQNDGKINIITGPNMGGKSSYIRQVALLIIMAQVGSYVPASSMKLTLFDRILTRIGAQDSILDGMSTFRMEMEDVLRCLTQSTSRSLLLLDEVGRGTGSIDGKAISYALLRYLVGQDTNCPLVLFTTHFPELSNSIHSPLLKNYFMDFVEEYKENESWPSVIFLYTLKPGVSSDSYGLNVAKLAHIPLAILESAFEKSSQLKEREKNETTLLNTPLMIKQILQNLNSDNNYDKESLVSLYNGLLESITE
ncbi:mismatch repair protein [Maudiozyma humilis]|uniref:DNA mismatch repair protein MSH3 n=1 Tax=Maudiozyma humilis TaxID=51915 RepID=A0AAV5RRF0_MAUHU|nr:mismatch repair protein [Kazachstania humilis]